MKGDEANFLPTFGAAKVAVRAGRILGHGPAMYLGKDVCVEGDEDTVVVAGCSYSTSEYPLPGSGTLRIQQLAEDQRAVKTRTGTKLILMVGSVFTAMFLIDIPAKKSPILHDATRQYTGSGFFRSSNFTFLAT